MSEGASIAGRRIETRRRGPFLSVVLALVVTTLDGAMLALALGGLGALLRHPRAPWLLLCWAFAALTLALVRPVRVQHVVETSAEPRWTLLALGTLPFLLPPLAAWDERARLLPLPLGSAARWAGVALVVLGLGLRILAMARLGSRFSPLVAVQSEHRLETRGLYGWVRHPGYAGAWLAALGAALTFGSGLALLPLALFGSLLLARARREEALMERRFGEEWRAYRGRTGAFLPRIGGGRRSA